MSIYAAEAQNQTHTVTNVSFSGNVYVPEPFSITFAPTLFIQSSTVNITNCQFIASQGSALYVDNSTVHLLGHNYFRYNTGYQGAAMYLGQGAELQLILTLVMFEGNHANATGGAIYIAGGSCSVTPTCPFAYPINSTLNFSKNVAESGGDAVYGGDLDQSYVLQICSLLLHRNF